MTGVTVKTGELLKAVKTPKMKRGPRGSRASIESTTILFYAKDHLIIEAPAHTSSIPCTGYITERLVLDAKLLERTVMGLSSVDTVTLSKSKENKLIFVSGKLKCLISLANNVT